MDIRPWTLPSEHSTWRTFTSSQASRAPVTLPQTSSWMSTCLASLQTLGSCTCRRVATSSAWFSSSRQKFWTNFVSTKAMRPAARRTLAPKKISTANTHLCGTDLEESSAGSQRPKKCSKRVGSCSKVSSA